jgi:hypothetical protein
VFYARELGRRIVVLSPTACAQRSSGPGAFAPHAKGCGKTENNWLNIKAGRSKTKMIGMAATNFPALPAFPAAGIEVPIPMFSEDHLRVL